MRAARRHHSLIGSSLPKWSSSWTNVAFMWTCELVSTSGPGWVFSSLWPELWCAPCTLTKWKTMNMPNKCSLSSSSPWASTVLSAFFWPRECARGKGHSCESISYCTWCLSSSESPSFWSVWWRICGGLVYWDCSLVRVNESWQHWILLFSRLSLSPCYRTSCRIGLLLQWCYKVHPKECKFSFCQNPFPPFSDVIPLYMLVAVVSLYREFFYSAEKKSKVDERKPSDNEKNAETELPREIQSVWLLCSSSRTHLSLAKPRIISIKTLLRERIHSLATLLTNRVPWLRCPNMLSKNWPPTKRPNSDNRATTTAVSRVNHPLQRVKKIHRLVMIGRVDQDRTWLISFEIVLKRANHLQKPWCNASIVAFISRTRSMRQLPKTYH